MPTLIPDERLGGQSVGITIGSMHVRRNIWIQASVSRVWQEFESFDRFVAWFGRGHTIHEFELQAGGMADLSVEIDGEPRHFGGRVVVFDPERELTFESNWHAPHAWPVPAFFTLRLTPLYDGTLVEVFHHGFERQGRDAGDLLAGYEDAWDLKHLKALREIVED